MNSSMMAQLSWLVSLTYSKQNYQIQISRELTKLSAIFLIPNTNLNADVGVDVILYRSPYLITEIGTQPPQMLHRHTRLHQRLLGKNGSLPMLIYAVVQHRRQSCILHLMSPPIQKRRIASDRERKFRHNLSGIHHRHTIGKTTPRVISQSEDSRCRKRRI